MYLHPFPSTCGGLMHSCTSWGGKKPRILVEGKLLHVLYSNIKIYVRRLHYKYYVVKFTYFTTVDSDICKKGAAFILNFLSLKTF
jgi:hypothetical protein